MNQAPLPISAFSASITKKDLSSMLKFIGTVTKLANDENYQAQLITELPITGQHPLNHYAVMMAYDFHLSALGPKLIEINTNAGGLWFAYRCYVQQAKQFEGRFAQRLLNTFLTDYALFKQTTTAKPSTLVILDEQPKTQFLYPEMTLFVALFQQAGITALIADPSQLYLKDDGLYIDNQRVDMIYNRHCDFYLTTPSMCHIKDAWLQNTVCLSPNPRLYGLLADKRRMILWSNPQQLAHFQLTLAERQLFADIIPKTQLLSELSLENAWLTRKQWVFKPTIGFGSQGVYVGHKLTKTKLNNLPPEHTLIQQWIPPSVSYNENNLAFKTDIRLFVYHQHPLAITARLYQGQVTNMHTPHGGFAKVVIT